MPSIFVDSNYLIYLKYSQEDEIFDYCVNLLKKLENFEVLANIVVFDEVIWILNRKYGVELEEIFEYLDKISDFVRLIPIGFEEYEVMKEIMLRFGLKPSDAIHVATMKKAGTAEIVSEDRDFDRIDWLKRIWIGKD